VTFRAVCGYLCSHWTPSGGPRSLFRGVGEGAKNSGIHLLAAFNSPAESSGKRTGLNGARPAQLVQSEPEPAPQHEGVDLSPRMTPTGVPDGSLVLSSSSCFQLTPYSPQPRATRTNQATDAQLKHLLRSWSRLRKPLSRHIVRINQASHPQYITAELCIYPNRLQLHRNFPAAGRQNFAACACLLGHADQTRTSRSGRGHCRSPSRPSACPTYF